MTKKINKIVTQLEPFFSALKYIQNGYSIIPLRSIEMAEAIPKSDVKALLDKALEKYTDSDNAMYVDRFNLIKRIDHKIAKGLISDEDVTKMHTDLYTMLPLIDNWEDYTKRLPDVMEIKTWFDTYPDAVIGLVTGAISDTIVFVYRHDQEDFARNLEDFKSAPKCKLIDGVQIFMKYPKGYLTNFNRACPYGKYSMHSDNSYVPVPLLTDRLNWDDGLTIIDIEPAELTHVTNQ